VFYDSPKHSWDQEWYAGGVQLPYKNVFMLEIYYRRELTIGFVDKLPEAEQAEEALGDEEGRVADRIWLFGDGDITKVHHSIKNPVS
jgi:hypothetical protein